MGMRDSDSALLARFGDIGVLAEKRPEIAVGDRRVIDSHKICRRFQSRENHVSDLAARNAFFAVARGNITRPETDVLPIRAVLESQKDRGMSVLIFSHLT